MPDGKDGDGKWAYVNIQTNTDSIANPDTLFEEMINNERIRKTNLVNKIDHLATQLDNVYETLDLDFHRENSNENDYESTLKETEAQRNTNLSKSNDIH